MKLPSRRSERIAPPHRIMGDSLRIDCTACEGPSRPNDLSCIRCICFLLMDNQAVERVMLRQYDDRVIRGDAVSVLKDLALCLSVIRSIKSPAKRRCSGCPSSASSLMEMAWEGFPGIPTAALPPAKMRSGCPACLEKTQNALGRSNMMYDTGVSRASFLAFNRSR